MDAPSDLIVDVARAADPTRAATVTRRLEALGSSSGAASADFASALSATGGATTTNSARTTLSNLVGGRTASLDSTAGPMSRADKARQQFESTLLNSFVSEMMPKDTEAVYGGDGYAGDMWKSLLAEKISNEIAKSGALGLTRSLFTGGQHSPLEKLETATHAGSTEPNSTIMSANALSLPATASTVEGDFLFAHGKTL